MPDNVFESLEELEMRRRWPRAQAQMRSLVDHIRDIRLRKNAEPLPPEMAPAERSELMNGLLAAFRETAPPGVSETVLRRMARKVGDYFLWRRETTTPVIHELLVLAPWWIANMPGEVFARLRDIGLEHILNGAVKPAQEVWAELLRAPVVFMGHCTCRSSRVSQDLYADGERVYLHASADDARVLLDRFVDRFEELRARFGGAIPDCDPFFVGVASDLSDARRAGSDDYRLETLLRRTHPFWEFLPVLEMYTPTWIRSLHANRKAKLLHKELAVELAVAMYAGKGVVFSTMQLFDQPYCICSCPTPENGGGCVLTNWHYGQNSDHSLIPSDAAHGRRRAPDGAVLPCDRFPIRAERECIGCGCVHDRPDSRSLATVLAEADRARAAAGL